MKKEQEEKYLKEFDEIYQKYPINKSEIEQIRQFCESEVPEIIQKDNKSRQKKWIIFFVILTILAIIGIFVYRGVIKFIIGIVLLGIVCGGLNS